MGVDFRNSETKDNLMRAFAGESQARNRYTFAAGQPRFFCIRQIRKKNMGRFFIII